MVAGVNEAIYKIIHLSPFVQIRIAVCLVVL